MNDNETQILFTENFQRITSKTPRNVRREYELLQREAAEFQLLVSLFAGSYQKWFPGLCEIRPLRAGAEWQVEIEAPETIACICEDFQIPFDKHPESIMARVTPLRIDRDVTYYSGDSCELALSVYNTSNDFSRFDCFPSYLRLSAYLRGMSIEEQFQSVIDAYGLINDSPIPRISIDKDKWYCGERRGNLRPSRRRNIFFLQEALQRSGCRMYGEVQKIVEGEKSILMPLISWTPILSRHLVGSPTLKRKVLPETIPFYRPSLEHFGPEICDRVVLTDSMELAQENAIAWREKGIHDFEWLSWYGDSDTVSRMEWAKLKGKEVFYLLIRHSGYNVQQIFNTAGRVLSQMRANEVKNVRFVSFIHSAEMVKDRWGLFAGVPEILTPAEFHDLGKRCPWIPRSVDTRHYTKRPYLVDSILKEKSVTAIFGESEPLNWFSLSAAYLLAQGEINQQGAGQPPPRVLYVHEYEEDASIENRLETLLRMQTKNRQHFLDRFEIPPVTNYEPESFPRNKQTSYAFREPRDLAGSDKRQPNANQRPSARESRDVDCRNEQNSIEIWTDRFYWCSFSKYELDLTSPAGQAKILYTLDRLNRTKEDETDKRVKLLVVSGFESLRSVYNKSSDRRTQRMVWFCEQVKRRGSALLLVFPGAARHSMNAIEEMKDLQPDDLFEIRREIAPVPDHVAMSLTPYIVSERRGHLARPLMMEFAPNEDVPAWTFFSMPWSVQQQNRVMRRLRGRGFRWKDIARFLCDILPDEEKSLEAIDRMAGRLRRRATRTGLSKSRDKETSSMGDLLSLPFLHSSDECELITRLVSMLEEEKGSEAIAGALGMTEDDYLAKMTEIVGDN